MISSESLPTPLFAAFVRLLLQLVCNSLHHMCQLALTHNPRARFFFSFFFLIFISCANSFFFMCQLFFFHVQLLLQLVCNSLHHMCQLALTHNQRARKLFLFLPSLPPILTSNLSQLSFNCCFCFVFVFFFVLFLL